MLLHLTANHFFRIQMGLGEGTNNYAELIIFGHLLHFAFEKGCRHIQIFGDSKLIINWFNQQSVCHVHTLRNILDEALLLKSQFDTIICHHIYREHNQISDILSKEATLQPRGHWMIQEQIEHEYYQYLHRPYDDQQHAGAARP